MEATDLIGQRYKIEEMQKLENIRGICPLGQIVYLHAYRDTNKVITE
ncbi:hypothetical protein AZO1586I_728 [Bathymodiolus thermophilus thioautotrophic gill symbiont]|jgi:hypothetical protein|uniref:Uncharacterized protein n=1 Tax=Bathymodiolus thermophilus thioautotrophic gill symbiont TaxID=2360 RepID=A0ABN7G9R8_9GAMM|nr:hypothetical protein AZO1586I_728 [Bathymodiolus thermophilus thioautotrophic gill symbiont]SCN47030.1 hypothetical protein BAZMOX_04316_4 [methanotrophic endosymbiont of Bathymodiolus azoricus (Menez Gwen)]